MIHLDWARIKLILSVPLTESQVEGFNVIVETLNKEGANLKEASYILATALFDSSRKMQPHVEDEDEDFYREMYDIEGLRKVIAIRLGNTVAGDGAKYKHRGFIPLLGKVNYKAFNDTVGIDLVETPEVVESLKVASEILVKGMLQGIFTGVPLSRYINSRKTDYINARRVTKGVDNAKKIALLAEQLEKAIKES